MGWFYQTRGYGLGNFVMATPALRLMSDAAGEKIDVYFETAPVKELYVNCPFINIIQSPGPKSKMLGRTGKLGLQKGESEIQGFCRIMPGIVRKLCDLPHTYVDNDVTKCLDRNDPSAKYVAVVHGCLGKCYMNKKDVGVVMRQHIIDRIIDRGYVPVVLGNQNDFDSYWIKNDLSRCQNFLGKLSLKDSVSILIQCDFFISNDTGLYHVAGALRKDGLVLWRDTNVIKNQSPHIGISHIVGCGPKMMDVINSYIQNR